MSGVTKAKKKKKLIFIASHLTEPTWMARQHKPTVEALKHKIKLSNNEQQRKLK